MEKDFTFYNNAEDIYPVLLDVMSFIQTSASISCKQVTSRSSVILTELLTNGVKHAGDTPTLIRISRQEDGLHLIKSDQGRLFLPEKIGRLDKINLQAGKKISITSDPITELYAVAEDDYRLRFGVKDHPLNDDIPVQGLLEHYGLLMITKASDHFFYEYHPEQQLNVFWSVILL